MNDHQTVARRIAGQLEEVRRRAGQPRLRDVPVTVICVPRHGYAATRVNLESAYGGTGTRFLTFYLDINSPQAVQAYLAEQAAARDGFFHIRIDEYVSRQTARRLVLDLVPTRFTVFMDNNMLFSDGWLEHLIEATREPAEMVSPFIVMQGGRVHFSGSTIRKHADGTIARRQNTDESPPASRIEDARPRKMAIDFGESHCCLVTTAGFRRVIPDVFPEEMHNAHTLGLATYLLRSEHGQRMVVEPRALASILPIGFGFDIPWIFESYLDLDCLRQAYQLYGARIGRSVSTTLDNLAWHRKHLLYLLTTMLEKDFLERQTLLGPGEIPAYVDGYDRPLADDALDRLGQRLVPFVDAHHPRYSADLALWLSGEHTLQRDIDDLVSTLREERARRARATAGHGRERSGA